MTSPRLATALPLLLSLNAGYVDTAGFLALQGLFTAHVTGNFVTLGASLVLGISGAIAKLLALPVFCAGVIATRLVSTTMVRRGLPALKILLALKVVRRLQSNSDLLLTATPCRPSQPAWCWWRQCPYRTRCSA